jgi:hypothetical protein
MRGPVNTSIELTVLREGADQPIKIKVVRDIIAVKAVRYRVEEDVGYLRVISFTEKTYDDLSDAIEKISDEIGEDKLKGFVLDLRLNPGGLLDQAISVSDAFLDRGEIVSTRGRNPEETRRFNSRPGDLTGGKPVIVLINGGSASASEIVAGALQDHRRATILGTRSFGKGSVQTIIPLDAKTALRLTTALYYTPSGTSIQGTGIKPDIRVEQPVPEELRGRVKPSARANLRGHIQGENEDEEGSGSIAYVPPDPKDDVQLGYAMDLLARKRPIRPSRPIRTRRRSRTDDPFFPPPRICASFGLQARRRTDSIRPHRDSDQTSWTTRSINRWGRTASQGTNGLHAPAIPGPACCSFQPPFARSSALPRGWHCQAGASKAATPSSCLNNRNRPAPRIPRQARQGSRQRPALPGRRPRRPGPTARSTP